MPLISDGSHQYYKVPIDDSGLWQPVPNISLHEVFGISHYEEIQMLTNYFRLHEGNEVLGVSEELKRRIIITSGFFMSATRDIRYAVQPRVVVWVCI